jgi:DNA polymerase elongation subunit (family B)
VTPRIVTLDIETAPNVADVWGLIDQNVGINQLHSSTRVIAFAAKVYGEKRIEYRSEFDDGMEEMVKRAHAILDLADVVVHYNGTKFDMPHLRREFLLADMVPPSPVLEIDLLRVVRSRFRFTSNKLDFITQELGLPGKVKHEGHELWARCIRDRDPAAWALMKKYNIHDVRITELLYTRLRPWVKATVHHGLFADLDGVNRCPRCGGVDLQKRGFAHTSVSIFQRLQCMGCGSWSREKKSLSTVDMRGVE